jgi:DNA-binding transcriptional ArsR family regulator
MSQSRRPSARQTLFKKPALRASADIFAALGDETRLRMMAILCAGGAVSIAALTLGGDITRQAVTKHLTVLAQAGLVRDSKIGRERLWEIEPAAIDEARKSLDLIARNWELALNRLRVLVEQSPT